MCQGGERHWYRFGDQKGEFLSFTSGKAASPMYRELAGLPAEAAKLDYRAVAIGTARRRSRMVELNP
jgi:hypothetical protein